MTSDYTCFECVGYAVGSAMKRVCGNSSKYFHTFSINTFDLLYPVSDDASLN